MELIQQIEMEDNPKSYLLSIALQLWKNTKRKFARRRKIADMESLTEEKQDIEADSYSLEDEIIAREQAREVRKAVQELADKYRLPVYLYYMEGLPLQKIARVLKIPKGTVKSRLYQAREKLRKKLEVE